MRQKIAVTMGDAAGIGPEIIARHFARNAKSGACEGLFVIGDPDHMARALRLIDTDLPVIEIADPDSLPPRGLPVLRVGALPPDLAYGAISAKAGALAYAAILRAIALAKTGQIAAMVTAPIHKESFHAAGVPFPGHTELLAHETGTHDFAMLLTDGALRVILVSIHLSLREALERVTIANEIRTIRLAAAAMTALGIKSPKIAVAGLNPHAGEGGLFGAEEQMIIAPAIAAMRAEGLDVSGPFPPDTVFMQAKSGRFDIVVAQYHDQGLIPVKLGGIERGVNITIGLPIIRTSVDHGTAFDIAGKGIADATSLGEAIDAARAMIRAKADQARS